LYGPCGGWEDTAAINAALTFGQSISRPYVLIPGNCYINNTIRIQGLGFLEGYGNGVPIGPTPRSSLTWAGAAGAQMILFEASAGCATQASCILGNGGISNLAIFSNNGLAAVGVDVEAMWGGVFDHINGDNFSAEFLKIGAGLNLAVPFPTEYTNFNNITWSGSTSGIGIWDAGGALNVFNLITLQWSGTQDGILIGNLPGTGSPTTSSTVDADVFNVVTTVGGNGNAPTSVELACGSFNEAFNNLEGSVVVRGSSNCPGSVSTRAYNMASVYNRLVNTDRCDDAFALPSIESGGQLSWSSNCGGINEVGALCPGNGVTLGLACFYSGNGNPNGVLSAPNGSIYLRFDGGSSARLYQNTSGASTNGTVWTAQGS
jgi:hypothetical protein